MTGIAIAFFVLASIVAVAALWLLRKAEGHLADAKALLDESARFHDETEKLLAKWGPGAA